jgi:alpha,alpha-trehalase
MNYFKFLVIVGIFVACSKSFQPKYESDWTKVNEFARNNWENYLGSHPILPHKFSYSIDKAHLYYWDIYFINKGLIQHQKWDLAKNNLDNFIFEIDSFGFVPNATETWGYNRSQIPFFSMMVKEYYEALPQKDSIWLKKAYQACLKEYQFWVDTSSTAIENHKTSIPGLIRFYHHADSVELSHVYRNVGFKNRFNNDSTLTTLEQKRNFGANFIAECESGMDFTPRFQQNIINYAAVDLNSNIYQYEKNFVWFEKELEISPTVNWDSIAGVRKQLIQKYCWDDKRKIFTDYDFVNQRQNPTLSYAMFYPLAWGIATPQQTKGVVKNMPALETEYGIIAVEPTVTKQPRQWDHRSIWPPVQWITYTGLLNYGYTADANRVAMKFLDVVTKNFIQPVPSSYLVDGKTVVRKSGLTWEKYTPDGNLNDADYPCNEMLSWTGGVFVDLYIKVNQ